MDRSAKFAIVFLALFALPFCGFGLAAAAKGVSLLANGGSSQSWMLVAFGLVFSSIGFGTSRGCHLRTTQAQSRPTPPAGESRSALALAG
jgi:hypothetical protein